MPLFSVVIPTYNRAGLLIPVIRSVLAQTHPDFELLIIDDGSTDDTEDAVDTHFGGHPQIRYYRKKNEERSIARNTGFTLAHGEYVVFHDSDDWMRPHHLATLAQKIEQYPQAQFLATKFLIRRGGHEHPSDLAPLPEGFYDYRLFLPGNPLAAFVCVRRAYAGWRGFPPAFNMCEDWIFHLEHYYHEPLLLIDQATIDLYDHPQRSMANHQHAVQGRLAATQYLLPRLPLSPPERRQLLGHTHQFCAIHCYLDGQRAAALGHWRRSVAQLGVSTARWVLLGKIVVGKWLIHRLRGQGA
ncbi:MAG: glycosyltransferase [Bernardetiaceae bacterium]|jgi:GalNAc5-diNAcBac-PP-undecaprenol beta-1,3-glucosyltransferase|nr:glycosyltransferase [Bernardetiaceae bacterium]